jgi:protein-S-isoprenylcysteine O-methyltransferase Ste14
VREYTGTYTIVGKSRRKPGVGVGTASILVFALVMFLIVFVAAVISGNFWSIVNEFMRLFGYVAFAVDAVVVVVWVRRAGKGQNK